MRGKCRGYCVFLLTLLLIWVCQGSTRNGTVIAYLADGDKTENLLTIGGNRIEIDEKFESPGDVIPGTAFTKTVRVRNVGHSSCYVRIKAVFTDSELGKYCSIDWNTADFIYCAEDGFYYYIREVESGALTEYLFTTITVSAEAPSDAAGELSVLVYAESCQSADFGSYETAWDYYRRNQP